MLPQLSAFKVGPGPKNTCYIELEAGVANMLRRGKYSIPG